MPARRKTASAENRQHSNSAPHALPVGSIVTPERAAAAAAGGYTPYDHKRLQFGPSQSKQSPLTQALLRAANTRYRVKLATSMPFPNSALTISMVKASFLEGCTAVEAAGRVQRAHDDKKYAEVVGDIVRRLLLMTSLSPVSYRCLGSLCRSANALLNCGAKSKRRPRPSSPPITKSRQERNRSRLRSRA